MTVSEIKRKIDNLLFAKEEDEDLDCFDDDLDYEPVENPFSHLYFRNNIIKIVLTGGPCSGKSEFVKLASDELKKRNIPVFVVNETATELLKGNLVFDDDPVAFQKAVCFLQLQKEKAIENYTLDYLRKKNLTNAVIIYDRSAWDGRAYLDDDVWIQNVGRKYDVYNNLGNRFVIHLESAASIGKFSKDNNEERYETEECAARIDKRLFDIYRSHPYFAHIPAREDYEQKKAEFLKLFMAHVESKLISEMEDD